MPMGNKKSRINVPIVLETVLFSFGRSMRILAISKIRIIEITVRKISISPRVLMYLSELCVISAISFLNEMEIITTDTSKTIA